MTKTQQDDPMEDLSPEERLQVIEAETALLNAFSDTAEEILEAEKTETEIREIQEKINKK